MYNMTQFNWMGPFLRSQRKAAAHYGYSYAVSVNAKREKPFAHSVKIFWCASITPTHSLKNPGFNQLKIFGPNMKALQSCQTSS